MERITEPVEGQNDGQETTTPYGRLLVHYDLPMSFEGYFQETGRT